MATKKVLLAKPFNLRCPRCKQNMQTFSEILFVEGFLVVVNGICCGYEITSGEMEILGLLPDKGTDTKAH
jgi:hypothetical protein